MIYLIYQNCRRVFYRGEIVELEFQISNFTPESIPDCEAVCMLGGRELGRIPIPVQGTHLEGLRFRLDTGRLVCGEYPLGCRLLHRGKTLAEHCRQITVCPRPRQDGMSLWHWPSTVHYDALEAGRKTALRELDLLASMGFTWSQIPADWVITHPQEAFALIEEAMKRGIQLGILIRNGGGGIFRLDNDDPPEARCISWEGKETGLVNPEHPAFIHRVENFTESFMRLVREFPSCTTVFAASEAEDRLMLPCDPESRAKHEKRLGFPLSELRGIDRIFAESFPDPEEIRPGVIADDDRECAYCRYYFETGNGWADTNRRITEAVRRYRPDVRVIADPFRLAPLPKGASGQNTVSSWTYVNPDMKQTLFIETLAAVARFNRKQDFLPTITLWNYPGSMIPHLGNRFERKRTLRMSPDVWSECAWLNFSRGPCGIGCYLGSSLEFLLQRGGKPFIYSPETGTKIRDFSRKVLRPFGALTRCSQNVPRRVAVLDCMTSRVWGGIPRSHMHYQNYQIYNFYIVLAMAQIPADIIFEEDVAAGRLQNYDILAMPQVAVLPESIDAEIRKFAADHPVWCDSFYRGEMPNLLRFDFDFEYRKQVNANAIASGRDFLNKNDNPENQILEQEEMQGVTAEEDQRRMEAYAAELRTAVVSQFRREFDCDSPAVICNLRHLGRGLRLLYAVNDRRKYGARCGEYKAILEEGVAEKACFTIFDCPEKPLVRELISRKNCPVTALENTPGAWTWEAELPPAGGAIFAIQNSSFNQPPELAMWIADGKLEIALDAYERIASLYDISIVLPKDARGRRYVSDASGIYVAEKSYFRLSVPLADNQPLGEYQIRVVNLFTGRTLRGTIAVVSEQETGNSEQFIS